MATTVKILGSRAREQMPGTSITLLAPGFSGELTHLGTDEPAGGESTLPFAAAASGAEVMFAALLSLDLEARPPEDAPGLRSRSAVATHPRLIVPKRKGIAYALLQTDEQGVSTFVMPEARDSAEAVFPLVVEDRGATHRTLRVFMWTAMPVSAPGTLAVISRWERLRRPNQLLQFGERGVPHLPDWAAVTRGRALLLLHDTFGTPQSSFGEWLEDPAFETVWRRYEGRCIAYAHPTLASGPEQNLAWLGAHVKQLGEIDIVAHGRGGLLARALAADPALRVRRMCLVGVPNAGTPLAREAGLPRFLNGHIALLARTPRIQGAITLEGALGVARCVAMNLEAGLPGILAQAPDSAWLRSLAAARGSLPATYTVGAHCSRLEGGAALEIFGPDDFATLSNDLVVPTDSCHLLPGHALDALHLAGPDAHHHAYFAQPEVRERVAAWLE